MQSLSDPTPNPVFSLNLSLPLSKAFLRGVQAIAMAGTPHGVTSWADIVSIDEQRGPTYHIACQEWSDVSGPKPDPVAVDLYSIQRGLAKAFDSRFSQEFTISDRMMIIRAVLLQESSPESGAAALALYPILLSRIVQLAAFDQVIY